VDKFAEGAVWKAVPGFVRRVVAPPPTPSFGYLAAARPAQMLGFRAAQMAARMQVLSRTSVPRRSRSPSNSWNRSHEPNFDRPADSLDNLVFGVIAAANEPPSQLELDFGSGLSYRCAEEDDEEEECSEEECFNLGLVAERNTSLSMRSNSVPAGGPPSPHQEEAPKNTVPFVAPVDVGRTQAGELSYGEHVDVRSGFTGHDYAYEQASEPTVLCMSIWEGMQFLPMPSNAVNEALASEVQEWIENEGKALIESLNAIFKTETCVIDLESEADTVICTCGHQCLHHSNVRGNLRHCPMCRSPITAFVRADGILVE
jgi:hypothetical protein